MSHVDASGNPQMVDVNPKPVTARLARAEGLVTLPEGVLRLFDGREIQGPKGPVLATAAVAGTLAAKRTSELIPFCHGLNVEDCKIRFEVIEGRGVRVECSVKIEGKTGVEMEALTGVSVAALAIYDMCKAVSHEIEIGGIRLLEKRGGKSEYTRQV